MLRGEALTSSEAFAELGAPPPGGFLFFAGERSEAVALRARLTEAAVPRESYQVAAYWTDAAR